MGEDAAWENPPDAAAVDAVLTASRSLIAVATRSLGAAAEETTIAQYRALVVLASRGPQRMAAPASALGVAPSTAGRMCNRLVRKGLIRRHRARADRRAVLVSVTAVGRLVVDQATARRRTLIEEILPVMLAVAIAATISRALSYGTIYTTKLLRRGTDIDRTTPWRALSDLKVAQAMRPFRPSLPVPPGDDDGDGGVPARDWATLAGPVIYRGAPQALFGTESLAQALRQLEVYGHDGLPVLSADGHQIQGWITAPDVPRAIARQITTAQAESTQAQVSADREHADPDSLLRHPPTPLPGYQVAEITITAGSPAAGRKLGDVAWPRASAPVSVLCGHQLSPPRPEITLAAGDRVSLLTGAPDDAPSHPAHGRARPAGQGRER